VEEKTMHFYIFEVAKFFKTNVYNFPTSFHHLYLAKRAARHGTALARLGTGTVRHGHGRARRHAVPCLLVPPCQTPGTGTTLWGVKRAVPCPLARWHTSARAGPGTI
jgi:hypothetical protein